jgi:hypothetical protein
MDIDEPEPIALSQPEAILAQQPIPPQNVCLGSPMDIDEPEPIALNQPEAILAQQPIEPRTPQSSSQSDEHTPIALNKTEAILARQSTGSVSVESKSKWDSGATAARRAVKLFPRDSVTPVRNRHQSFEDTSRDITTPVLVTPTSVRPVVERTRHNAPTVSTVRHTPKSPFAGKAALEFFSRDEKVSLPGYEDQQLPASALKVELLKREMMERVRREEIESQNAALRHLGVRRPKSILIREPSPEWKRRALDAPKNGKFDPRAVHPDAVELNPRDFAKLVPATAWLNDDCVHSTLCCLAAYVNKQAGVKPKVDPPKCVAISSLYWTAFCGDHKKLYPRPFGRKWNMTPDNFLNIDTVLIPVNHGKHWTLIVIRPSRKSVSYIDSYGDRGVTHLRHTKDWLKLFLSDKYGGDDWKIEEFDAPPQTNAWDCGMFVITNAMCLALGLAPMCYDEGKMPLQRQRIAAMLLNGGFHGDFDLGHL